MVLATRRHILHLLAALGVATLPGFALLFRGVVPEGERSRTSRVGHLDLDLLIMPVLILPGAILPVPLGLIVDFATGAIHRPTRRIEQRPLPDEDNRDGPYAGDSVGGLRLSRGERLQPIPVCGTASALVRSMPRRRLRHSLTAHLHECAACQGALFASHPAPAVTLDHDVQVAELGRSTLDVHPQHATAVAALFTAA